MTWTQAQAQAIETRGKNLLVAAAAGSGKTAVLVERIIRFVVGGECDIDELLTVTFTHAAADEMSGRIAAALTEKLTAERDAKKIAHLERQLLLLPSASISTFHSFCQTIIRQNFAAADIDPEFRLASEQELRLMRRDVLDDMLEAEYEAQDAAFLRFADDFGGSEKNDERLASLLLRLYDFSRSRPFPERWLKSLAADFSPADDAHLKNTPWFPAAKEEIRLALFAARADNEEAAAVAADFAFANYAASLEEHCSIIEKAVAALDGDWEKLRATFLAMKFNLKAEKDADEDAKAAVAALRDRYKKNLAAVSEKYFAASERELIDDIRRAAPYMNELCRLALKFADMFRAAKREKMLADFADLEHFALDILTDGDANENELAPSSAAKTLRQKYKAVMIDEYQDTNGVQEAILSLVVGNEPKLFAVGDVKQSIYRFRLADPALFMEKYLSYPTLGSDYARIDLKQNFRSRSEVLAAINFVFVQLMTGGATELFYDDAAMLRAGADYPPCEKQTLTGDAELNVIFGDDDDATAVEREAQLIANRLHELMAADTQVYDKDKKKYRPLMWRDAAILMRSVKGKAEKILAVLKANNIPAYASMDAGYFESQEIRLMLALLSVLDNARQDIPLAAVLLSPVGAMSAAELAALRTEATGGDLFDALLFAGSPNANIGETLRQKAADFLARLTAWRNMARELSVPETIWQLYRDTGYYDYVGSLSGGALRQANLRMLADRAAEYEKTNFRGLFRFLRFVERMLDSNTDLAAARTLGESENVVRIMTIHKSKGLEFPLVFLASLGTRFGGDADELLLHGELGAGPYVVAENAAFRYPTFARAAMEHRLRQEARAEELRVFYVAMTRAREKLIFIGSVGTEKKLRDAAKKYCRFTQRNKAALPEHAVFGADSFLAWLLATVSRHAGGAPLVDFAQTNAAAPFIDYKDDSAWRVNIIAASSLKKESQPVGADAVLTAVKNREKLAATPCKKQIDALLDWQYPHRELAAVAAKFSVTELKRRFAADDADAAPNIAAAETWSRPRFLQQGGLTGTEYGSIMHGVMQHIDLSGDLTARGIKAQLRDMAARQIFLDDEIKIVRAGNIAKFFASAVGQRMLRAKKIWREIPFGKMMPAKIFYPEIDGDEEIFIQGVIDLLFEETDGLVLVDYKTDGDTTEDAARERYRLQIALYSDAAESILQKKITERYLYMLHDGKTISI